MIRRHSPLVATVAALAVGLTGCSTAEPGTGATDSSIDATSEERAGGDLVHLLAALRTSWQQQDANNWYQSQVWAQLTETLVYVDDEGAIHPWLADSWEISEDGLQYDVRVRDGVTFSDGTPLTAQIVADNLNLLGLGDESRAIVRVPAFPKGYENAETIDDSTVRITLTQPDSGFLATLGYHSAGILAPSTIDAGREEQSDLANVVGTGPFVLDSYTAEKEVVLVKREDYDWPHEGSAHEGPAYLDSITFRVVPEDSVRLGALEAGQADTLHYVQPTEEERLQEAGFNVIAAQYLGATLGLELRTTAQFLDDVRVRQAIQFGIDRDELIDTLYSSNWQPASSVLQRNVPGWVDLSDEFAFDPERSAALLDEAGWTQTDTEGYRVKDGERLSLYVYPSPIINTSDAELQLIAQQLKELGIDLQLRQTDVSNYSTAVASDDLPVYQSHFTLLDVSYLRPWWHSTQANRFRANDPVLDDLLDKVSVTLDEQQKAQYAEQLQHYLIEQAYFIPLEEAAQVFVTAPNVHDLPINAVGRQFFYDTWLSD